MAAKSSHSSDYPPSYDDIVHGQSSSRSAPAPTGVYGPMVQGPDMAYLKSLPGIVKIVQAVSKLVI